MIRWAVAALLALAASLVPGQAYADDGCNTISTFACPGVTADQQAGDFHGLIMVPGQPNVLERAAHSGTKPGCGDCVWELVPACPTDLPSDPNTQDALCAGVTNHTVCPDGLLFRLYLSTSNSNFALVDHLCLGANTHVVPVGEQAAADVQRYLKDVTPPDVQLNIDPPNGIPAGMPAYFWVRPPAIAPAPFGGGQVTETITLKPERYNWTWGDGASSGWTDNQGAPYPDGTLTHTYVKSDRYAGQVVVEWGGTYTITVAGQTFGPYDAVGTVTKQQPFSIAVLKAHSALVSHG